MTRREMIRELVESYGFSYSDASLAVSRFGHLPVDEAAARCRRADAMRGPTLQSHALLAPLTGGRQGKYRRPW